MLKAKRITATKIFFLREKMPVFVPVEDFKTIKPALGAGFALRYLVPVVAELSIMGTLSAESLVSAARGWRVRRASLQSSREADRG